MVLSKQICRPKLVARHTKGEKGEIMAKKNPEVKTIKVYINDNKKSGKRRLVEAKVISERPTTLVVELADGNQIVRKKTRDLVKQEA